jgi:hypothetical protein
MHPHRFLSTELFRFGSLLESKFVGAEFEFDFLECAGELEGHLRVVLADDRRPGMAFQVFLTMTFGGTPCRLQ